MTRTYGAKDKKKRKFYAGKPVKKRMRRHGVMVPYVPRRSRDDPIKVWFWEQRPMSKEGYKHFPKRIRSHIRKTVYAPYLRVDVDSSKLSNVKKIGDLALETIGHEGVFLLKLFGHAKNKYHCTNRKVAIIKITEHPDGLKAKVEEHWRIARYWFWNK